MMLADRILSVLAGGAFLLQGGAPAAAPRAALPGRIVLTQAPVRKTPQKSASDGARLLLLLPGGGARVLTAGFESAADPEVSFDGERILFAGRRNASDSWNIFEMKADGSGLRQITRGIGNCRSPSYQSELFTLDAPKPWNQVTFVSDAAGEIDEAGRSVATQLYSIKLDGSGLRRLTYNPSGSRDPVMAPDGRIIFSAWSGGRLGLFGINLDGTDYAAFSVQEGRRLKQTTCITAGGLALFVEADEPSWDGAGRLAAVTLRRPLKSYRAIAPAAAGLFHSPSPLPDGAVLVSRRSADGSGSHGLYRLNPATGALQLVFDSPAWHDIQARLLASRRVPDGRSSVVEEEKSPNAQLYCLNVYTNDLPDSKWMPAGSVKRIRIVEGAPRKADSKGPPLERRLLGEFEAQADGSFKANIPAGVPVQVQILDADGVALRTSAWFWAKNRENRGCIGCHEDGERTPENVFPSAIAKPPVNLTLPQERRRRVQFRDVAPTLAAKCGNRACHSGNLAGWVMKQVHPGESRTSPLVWRLLGRSAARPWDSVAGPASLPKMPPAGSPPLTEDEKLAIIEWIDLGAQP